MKLVDVLKERNISKLQLALNTGINPAFIYDAFNGKRDLYPGWKKRIAEYLKMEESELFEEDDDEND